MVLLSCKVIDNLVVTLLKTKATTLHKRQFFGKHFQCISKA